MGERRTYSEEFKKEAVELVYYNRIRLHSTLDYKSPQDYESERKMSNLCV